MSNQYTRDYFIAKFEAIPEEKWRVGLGDYRTGITCAYGHCGLGTDYTESFRLADLIGDAGKINDGRDERFQQPTPKARILAALRSLQPDKE